MTENLTDSVVLINAEVEASAQKAQQKEIEYIVRNAVSIFLSSVSFLCLWDDLLNSESVSFREILSLFCWTVGISVCLYECIKINSEKGQKMTKEAVYVSFFLISVPAIFGDVSWVLFLLPNQILSARPYFLVGLSHFFLFLASYTYQTSQFSSVLNSFPSSIAVVSLVEHFVEYSDISDSISIGKWPMIISVIFNLFAHAMLMLHFLDVDNDYVKGIMRMRKEE